MNIKHQKMLILKNNQKHGYESNSLSKFEKLENQSLQQSTLRRKQSSHEIKNLNKQNSSNLNNSRPQSNYYESANQDSKILRVSKMMNGALQQSKIEELKNRFKKIKNNYDANHQNINKNITETLENFNQSLKNSLNKERKVNEFSINQQELTFSQSSSFENNSSYSCVNLYKKQNQIKKFETKQNEDKIFSQRLNESIVSLSGLSVGNKKYRSLSKQLQSIGHNQLIQLFIEQIQDNQKNKHLIQQNSHSVNNFKLQLKQKDEVIIKLRKDLQEKRSQIQVLLATQKKNLELIDKLKKNGKEGNNQQSSSSLLLEKTISLLNNQNLNKKQTKNEQVDYKEKHDQLKKYMNEYINSVNQAYEQYKRNLSQLKQSNSRLKQEINRMSSQLEECYRKSKQYEKQNDLLNLDIEKVEHALRNSKCFIKQLQEEFISLKDENTELRKENQGEKRQKQSKRHQCNELMSQNEYLAQGIQQLKDQLGQLTIQNKNLAAQNSDLVAQNNNLAAQNRSLAVHNSNLGIQKSKISEQFKQLQQKVVSNSELSKQVKQMLTQLAQQKQHYLQQLNAKQQNCKNLTQQLRQNKQSHQSLKQMLKNIETQLSAAYQIRNDKEMLVHKIQCELQNQKRTNQMLLKQNQILNQTNQQLEKLQNQILEDYEHQKNLNDSLKQQLIAIMSQVKDIESVYQKELTSNEMIKHQLQIYWKNQLYSHSQPQYKGTQTQSQSQAPLLVLDHYNPPFVSTSDQPNLFVSKEKVQRLKQKKQNSSKQTLNQQNSSHQISFKKNSQITKEGSSSMFKPHFNLEEINSCSKGSSQVKNMIEGSSIQGSRIQERYFSESDSQAQNQLKIFQQSRKNNNFPQHQDLKSKILNLQKVNKIKQQLKQTKIN